MRGKAGLLAGLLLTMALVGCSDDKGGGGVASAGGTVTASAAA